MKKISLVVPCYNEEKSINDIHSIVKSMFENELINYEYELIFVDDYSTDATREIIRELCTRDGHVKAVFNMSNFGFSRNVFSALQQGSGDATFLFFGDMQDPPELLPKFIEKWEEGARVVIGQKTKSEENKIMFSMRKAYYGTIDKLAESKQIRQYTGFGLYDQKFIDAIKQIDDLQPYLKTVIAEYSPNYATVKYEQKKSKRGKSNFNFYRNYDFAMEGITSSTKKLMRMATFAGASLGILSVIYGIYVFVRKLIDWNSYPMGMASMSVGIFLLGSIQLFFIGILGEYVLSINTKSQRKPRVIIDEKINFEE